jgi:hypothetical protein
LEVEAAVGRSAANELTRKKLLDSLKLAHMLGTCRVCGHGIGPSTFHGSEHGFRADCGNCGAHWTLKTLGGKPVQAEYRTGKIARPFAEVGCRQLTITWPPPLASRNLAEKQREGVHENRA